MKNKIPRTNGGKYNKANCVGLCKGHHEGITFQKWQGNPGSIKKKKCAKRKNHNGRRKTGNGKTEGVILH